MFTSMPTVLSSQLQCLNETRSSVLNVLVATAAVERVPLSVVTPLCRYVSAHHVRRQVAQLHGADSLIFIIKSRVKDVKEL